MSVDVTVSNVGAVEDFSFTMASPGLFSLRGKPGSGKTTILRTVELATNGSTGIKPTKRDGTKGGSATIAGKTLKIARTVREEGELGVEGLGDMDLGQLLSPQYADAITRDKYRIGVLAKLAGVKADVSLFYDLLGGEEAFKEAVDISSIASNDLVEMAAKAKRAIDKLALAAEKDATQAEANYNAKHAQTIGLDLEAPSDAKELSDALEAAISAEAGLKSQRKSAEATLKGAAEARKQLEAQDLPDVDALKGQAEGIPKRRGEIIRRIDELKAEIQALAGKLDALNAEADSLDKQIASANQAKAAADNWRKAIEAAESVENPTDEALQAATQAVADARTAFATGEKVRNALKAKAEAEGLKIKHKELAKSAEKLREAAKKTTGVVSAAIQRLEDCPITVWNDDDGDARLVTATDRSEREPFDELSDGERLKLVLPLCLKKDRLVTLSQASYGEISPADRKYIHEVARQKGAYVLTAEVSDGELRGVPFGD